MDSEMAAGHIWLASEEGGQQPNTLGEISQFNKLLQRLTVEELAEYDPASSGIQPFRLFCYPAYLRANYPHVASATDKVRWGETNDLPIPAELADELWHRDRYIWLDQCRCADCGVWMKRTGLNKQALPTRVIPQRYGGTTTLDNLVLQCTDCSWKNNDRMPFSVKRWERHLAARESAGVKRGLIEATGVTFVALALGPMCGLLTGLWVGVTELENQLRL